MKNLTRSNVLAATLACAMEEVIELLKTWELENLIPEFTSKYIISHYLFLFVWPVSC